MKMPVPLKFTTDPRESLSACLSIWYGCGGALDNMSLAMWRGLTATCPDSLSVKIYDSLLQNKMLKGKLLHHGFSQRGRRDESPS